MSVSALDANVITLPSCTSALPRPRRDAFTWIIVSLSGSKHVSDRTEDSSHSNNQFEGTVAKLTLNQNAFIQKEQHSIIAGFCMLYN